MAGRYLNVWVTNFWISLWRYGCIHQHESSCENAGQGRKARVTRKRPSSHMEESEGGEGGLPRELSAQGLAAWCRSRRGVNFLPTRVRFRMYYLKGLSSTCKLRQTTYVNFKHNYMVDESPEFTQPGVRRSTWNRPYSGKASRIWILKRCTCPLRFNRSEAN